WAAPAVICMLATKDNVRLGDIAAGTIVVRERTGATMPTPTTFRAPYGCEAYVNSLDVSGLTAEDYGAVRNLLLRTPSLGQPPRWDLSRQLGTHIAARMRHTPPDWVGPEPFLACAAAAYQHRYAGPPPPTTPAPTMAWGAPPPGTPTDTAAASPAAPTP